VRLRALAAWVVGEQLLPRPPTHQHRIPLIEKARPRRGDRLPAAELDQPVVAMPQIGRDRLQTGARVTQRQSCPLGQVAVIGRSVSDQVAARQLGQRPAPRRRRRLPEPLWGRNVRVAAARERTPHSNTAQACQHQQVYQRLAGGGDVGGRHPLTQLFTCQRPLIGQRPLDHSDTAIGRIRRDAALHEPASVAGEERRRCQRVQPPVILAADEVQRPAVQPTDDQGPVIEAAVDDVTRQAVRAGADGEPGAAQVLRLYREQPVGDVGRAAAPLVTEELRRPPLFEHAAHGAYSRLPPWRGPPPGFASTPSWWW